MSKPQVTVIGAGIVGVCSAAWLQREGFADVVHVGKGVGAWRAAGNPVESGAARNPSAV